MLNRLSLSLLETGILFVDNVEFALPANDLAINAALFNGCSYFHFLNFYPLPWYYQDKAVIYSSICI